MANKKGFDRKPYLVRAKEKEDRKYSKANSAKLKAILGNYRATLRDDDSAPFITTKDINIRKLDFISYESYVKGIQRYLYTNFLKYKNKNDMWAKKGLNKDIIELAIILFKHYHNVVSFINDRNYIGLNNDFFKKEILDFVENEIFVLLAMEAKWGDITVYKIYGESIHSYFTNHMGYEYIDDAFYRQSALSTINKLRLERGEEILVDTKIYPSNEIFNKIKNTLSKDDRNLFDLGMERA